MAPSATMISRGESARVFFQRSLIIIVATLIGLVSNSLMCSTELEPTNPEAKSSLSRKLAQVNLRQYISSLDRTTDSVQIETGLKPINCYTFQKANINDYSHAYIWAIAKEVFPECRGKAVTLNQQTLRSATDDDFLFFPQERQPYLVASFPGTVLFFREEAHFNDRKWKKSQVGHRWFALGHLPPSESTLYFPVLAQRIAALGASDIQDIRKLLRVQLRPRNSGEHFLMYIQRHSVQHREDAFNTLASIGTVHFGGDCNGNGKKHGMLCYPYTPNPRPHVTQSPFVSVSMSERIRYAGGDLENRQLYSHYRFALVMENQNSPGYFTEKILFAFLGGAIPIWYGSKEIFRIINREAFVYYDVQDPEPALTLVRHLEQNKTAYDEMLSRPILAHDKNTIKEYFSVSDRIGGGALKRRIRQLVGIDKGSHLAKGSRSALTMFLRRSVWAWTNSLCTYDGEFTTCLSCRPCYGRPSPGSLYQFLRIH